MQKSRGVIRCYTLVKGPTASLLSKILGVFFLASLGREAKG